MIEGVGKDGIINRYHEYSKDRKGFNLDMLRERWNMSGADILALLKRYEVPGHIRQKDMLNVNENNPPSNVAIFWEEYIHAIEHKELIPHAKVKSRRFEMPKPN